MIDLDRGWPTERLDLEPLDRAHAAELAPWLDDASLHEFIGGAPLSAADLAARYARLAVRRSPSGDQLWGNWVMRVRESGAAVGTVQATLPAGGPATGPAEVAWVVATAAQGRGYAKEAARSLVTLLQGAGWTVTAYIHPGHLASQRVARAAGLSPTGQIRDGEMQWASSPAGSPGLSGAWEPGSGHDRRSRRGDTMEPMPEDWERAVAVVAHPDDLEYGAAAAVARWTGQGKQVAYVLATRGEAGIEGMAPDVVGPLRVEEERRSAALVGVTEVDFLDHPDGLVEYGIPLRRDLAAALRRHRPDVVITMNFGLTWGEEGPVNHSDHRAVGLAAVDACRDAANSWVFPDAGPAWNGIKAIYVAASGDPTHYVDTTATIEAGIASLREHKAYLDGLGRDFDPDEFLRNMAGYIGLAAGCDYAVGLRRYPV